MTDCLRKHLALTHRTKAAIRAALESAYVASPVAPNAQLLLGLVVQAGEHARAITTLLEHHHYSGALIICRSCLESMAVAYGVVTDGKLMKLLEKKSLEEFRKRIREVGLLGYVSGLDETIRSIHPETTASLRVEKLLERYGTALWGADKNLFYASYRELCTFTHPDYLSLIQMVKVENSGRAIGLNPHATATDQHLHFGVGISAIITTAMLAVFDENTGIQFSPGTMRELEVILNSSLDIFAKREADIPGSDSCAI
jgi:hypothetical protein